MITNIIIIISLAFLTGIFVKATDLIIDDKKKILFNNSQFLFSILYGISIGVMIAKFPNIAPLWIGVFLGNLFYGRFDAMGHLISIPTVLITIVLIGYQEINLIIMGAFILICIFEEMLNDIVDKRNETKFIKIMKYRPLVEIAAIITAIVISDITFFLAILGFDIGYIFMRNLAK